jgi:hypothetical protein
MSSHQKINHVAIVVCVIVLFALGFFWYGSLFGETWMRMVGLSMEEIEASGPGAGVWITNLIATVVPLYVLAWLLLKLNVTTGLRGAGIGLLIGFAFIFLSRMTSDMFSQNPYGLSWIVGGYSMVALTVSGFILGAWTRNVPDGN